MDSMSRITVSLLWLAAVSAWAQPPAPVRAVISGVVMEPGVNQPVADAEITIAEFEFQPHKYNEVAKGKTDLQGAFRFEVDKFANYLVRATKPGYSESTGSLGGAQEEVLVDKDHLQRTVRFALSRNGELTGRVVDDETGTPIPNFHVQAMDVHYSRGEPIMGGNVVPATDTDGRFVAKGREPGNYVVQVVPQTLGNERIDDAIYRARSSDSRHRLRQRILARWTGSGFREPGPIAARRIGKRRDDSCEEDVVLQSARVDSVGQVARRGKN